jgi:hypothetical protein
MAIHESKNPRPQSDHPPPPQQVTMTVKANPFPISI